MNSTFFKRPTPAHGTGHHASTNGSRRLKKAPHMQGKVALVTPHLGRNKTDGPALQALRGQAANIRALQEGLRGVRGRKHLGGLGFASDGFLGHLVDQRARRLKGDAGEPLAALAGHSTEVPNALQQLAFRPLPVAGVVQRTVVDAFGREPFDAMGATALDTLLAGDTNLHDAIAELAGVEATVLASHLLSPRLLLAARVTHATGFRLELSARDPLKLQLPAARGVVLPRVVGGLVNVQRSGESRHGSEVLEGF